MAPEAVEAMLPYLSEHFENPSAPYARARAARTALEDARATLAHLMGAKPGNVVLTAGATEANNLAIAAADGIVLTDAIEHESVLASAGAHGRAMFGVGPDGSVDPQVVSHALTPEVGLVSVELANGEIGTVQPIRQIADVVARERQRRLEAGEARPLYLHTDASQAACTHAINVSALRADLVTLSAAKVYGPKQVGLLWAADGVRLRPLVHGGGQESGVRSGTDNVAGAVAFARAFQLASELRTSESKRLTKLRDRLQRSLTEDFPWMVVSGPRNASRRLPGLLSVSFPGLEARRLVVLLERRGVSVGTGSACAASRMKVSHVLFAIGLSSEAAAGSLRLTLGRPTTEDDIAYAAQAIASVVRDECARVGLDARTGERA
ncbi:MAG: cysteine desulfurase [Atopobiaceae bacterium]|nr:cysteine desulfurase [Atopobiaceae bacterium]